MGVASTAVESRRVPEVPVVPTKFTDESPPTYLGSLTLRGSGPTTAVNAALVVWNKGTTPRTISFSGPCVVAMYLTADSTQITPAAFHTKAGGFGCAKTPETDTVSPRGTMTFGIRHEAADFQGLLGNPPAPARYYVWVRARTDFRDSDVKVGLGWITVTP